MRQITKTRLTLLLICASYAPVMANSLELTVFNQTPTSFVAKTRFGQVLGRIPLQTPTTITVPVLALGKYAVSFIGNNGLNATLINKGNGAYCSTANYYHHCDITASDSNHAQLTIRANHLNPFV